MATGTADNDAVNVKQLNDSLAKLPTNPNAVSYDDATKATLTLDGPAYNPADGTGGTKITNVANATQASDAVNLGQLQEAGLFDPNGDALNAVVYDSDAKDNYRGETALGVGVSRWSDNGRLNLNAGVSAAKNDDPVIRVGIGYIF